MRENKKWPAGTLEERMRILPRGRVSRVARKEYDPAGAEILNAR